MNIILLGYMGAGKTTIGRALSRLTSREFYDLDWYIEQRFRKSVSDIFAEEGEAVFREREQALLHELAEFEDVILAVGGGTPCFFDNMDYMNSRAETVFLSCTVDTIIEHLHISHSRRPLLEGKTDDELRTFIGQNLDMRMPFYSRARHTLEVPTLRTKEQITDVAKKISLFL